MVIVNLCEFILIWYGFYFFLILIFILNVVLIYFVWILWRYLGLNVKFGEGYGVGFFEVLCFYFYIFM